MEHQNIELDETKKKEFIVAMEKTLVFTDKTNLTARKIVEIYDARYTIKSDIVWLNKLFIPLKPTYVRKDMMIKAHMFLCVMGFLISRN